MLERLGKNILNIAALIVSIAAVLISLRANEFSREANEIAKASQAPDMTVEWMYNNGVSGYTRMTACQTNGESASPVYLTGWKWGDQGLVMVANRGGRAASLIRVDLSPGVTIPFESASFHPKLFSKEGNGGAISLPVDIEPGVAKVWALEAEVIYRWVTKQDALDKTSWSGGPDMPEPTVFTFYFSDGSVMRLQNTNGVYRDTSSLWAGLDTPCINNELFPSDNQ